MEIDIPESEPTELELERPNSAVTARQSIWQKEQDIALKEKERTESKYGLRQRPRRKQS